MMTNCLRHSSSS